VPVDAAVGREIWHATAPLRRCPGVRWTDPALYHFTLRFLGPVHSDRRDALDEALQEAVAESREFELTLGGVGAFPDTRRPRVIWLSAQSGADALTRLAQRLERALVCRGFASETKAYRPHLTLGRAHGEVPVTSLQQAMAEVQSLSVVSSTQAGSLVLMSSELSPRGPRYTPLAELPLGSAPVGSHP
jgi:2'-5' RNA ligase